MKYLPLIGTSRKTAAAAVLCVVASVFIQAGLPAWAAPIPVENAADLQNIQDDLSAEYYLLNDISLSSAGNFTPIGTSAAPFTGMLDGRDYEITTSR